MKKLYVIVITTVVIGLMFAYPHIMLNPGDLTKGHQNIQTDCFACHKPFWGISNDKCISCHNLTAIGTKNAENTNTKKLLFHKSLTNQECSACHTDHIGIDPDKSINKFSHELISGTAINNCTDCHTIPNDNKHLKFKPECKSCHSINKWSDLQSFKHELIIENELNNCSTCHNNPGDEFHSVLTENCIVCHSTVKWKPSTFNHSSKFQLDKDHNAKCITCHTNNNYKKFTCYGCHEHTVENILSEHNEEGINNIEDCVSCHKSANEKDLKDGNNNKNENENNRKNDNDDD